ncbi:MAG TPA: FkbM family methyltransferase [Candidatus Dormibacteraeota bacterium]|nr:FkbM family methyltransferase [Candidatus Dormibacteraeota bacterium]
MLAPRELSDLLPETVPYAVARAETLDGLPWLAVHKGMLDALDPAVLARASATLRPVFANEVFVVLTARPDLRPLAADDRHVAALGSALRARQGPASAGPAERMVAPLLAGPGQVGDVSRSALEAACRAASQAAYLGGAVAVCRVLTRYLCYCDTSDRSLTPHLLLDGYWESWITQAMARVLRPGMRCLDLGANVGYFTLLMADAVGPEGRVAAVEANPRLVDLLGRSVDVNGFRDRVRLFHAAAADRSGDRLHLHVPAGHLGDGAVATYAGPESVEVDTAAVDDLLADWDRLDVVKVDIEGAEEAAWRGMSGLLGRSPGVTVVTEFDARRHYDARDFLGRMAAAGFRLRHVEDDGSIADLTAARALSEPRLWTLWLSRS